MIDLLRNLTSRPGAAAPAFEQVLPGVWRWADPKGSDRCGTGLASDDGLVLVDPPAFPGETVASLEAAAGPVRHVVLTSARHAALAAPYRDTGATVWAPLDAAGTTATTDTSVVTEAPTDPGEHIAQGRDGTGGRDGYDGGQRAVERRVGDQAGSRDGESDGIDRRFAPGDVLPGGLLACALPAEARLDGEVAFLWPPAGGGLLIVGDALPVVGQTPVYREGEAPPVPAFLDMLRALLAAEPGTLAPAHQAPPDSQVIYATAYAAHIGSPSHARRAAPIAGPRFLVPKATRVLEEALIAPVVVRPGNSGSPGDPRTSSVASRTETPEAEAGAASELAWIADPFACTACGKPTQPMRQTCGGPPIPRLCPECRTAQRTALPAARLMVCAGGCCTREGARGVISAARQEVLGRGLAGKIDVVPVSCLGECSLGPFLRVAVERNDEPSFAREFRTQTVTRARRYAADEGEVIDDESELVLSRFAALVQPAEAAALVTRLAADVGTGTQSTEEN